MVVITYDINKKVFFYELNSIIHNIFLITKSQGIKECLTMNIEQEKKLKKILTNAKPVKNFITIKVLANGEINIKIPVNNSCPEKDNKKLASS